MEDKDLRVEEENNDFPEPFAEKEKTVGSDLPKERTGISVKIKDGIKERRERAAEKKGL